MTLGEQVQDLQRKNVEQIVIINSLSQYLTKEQIQEALNKARAAVTPLA